MLFRSVEKVLRAGANGSQIATKPVNEVTAYCYTTAKRVCADEQRRDGRGRQDTRIPRPEGGPEGAEHARVIVRLRSVRSSTRTDNVAETSPTESHPAKGSRNSGDSCVAVGVHKWHFVDRYGGQGERR